MKWPIALSFAVVLAGSGIGASTAQTAPPIAPPIRAQKLVDEAMAKYPEVVILSMHVTPPQKTENVIIASNTRPQSTTHISQLHHHSQPAWIGRKSNADDYRVIRSGKGSLEVSQGGTHLEITLPLQDHSGTTIGAVGVVFNYKEGDDKGKLQKVAEQIRDAWRAQISNKDSLFEPAK